MERESLSGQKRALREAVERRRRGQSVLARLGRGRKACRRLARLSAWRSARVVFAYAPLPGELDVLPLVRDALAAGRMVAFPRVAGSRMTFHRVRSLGELRPGRFGILEPPAGAAVPVARADILLVPGVAFSPDGGRLGRGRGYYDRALGRRNGVAVGVGFDFQLVPRVPLGVHDAPLDAVVTDARAVFP